MLVRTVAKILDFIVIAAAAEILPKAGFYAGMVYLLIGDGLFDGRSLGKKLVGLRVVSAVTLRPCTFRDSILRNSILGVGYLFSKVLWFGWIFIMLVAAFEFIDFVVPISVIRQRTACGLATKLQKRLCLTALR